ncbi:hypothetical protein P8631_13725, partial [Guyparkeria sp. 1SP6A2]|nr:hypothetical protein [Guyparkeria sp. 1SP6A2]
MNFNQRFECTTCESLVDCRIGMSNRDIQPIRFCCPSCGEAIHIDIEDGKGVKVKWAKAVEFEGPFTNEY